MRRFLPAILCCLLAPGCMIVQTGVTNPLPGMSTVAVAPFFNLSGERAADGRRFASAYFSELQKVPGFQVVPLGVTETAIVENNLSMDNPHDVLHLAAILGVDAVVVGAVTDYDPYYPPRIGLHVSWFSPKPWTFHPGVPIDPDARKRLKSQQAAWRERERERKKQRRAAAESHPTCDHGPNCNQCAPAATDATPSGPVIRGQSEPLPRVQANGVDSAALARVMFPEYSTETAGEGPVPVHSPVAQVPTLVPQAAVQVPKAETARPVRVLRFTAPVVAESVSLPGIDLTAEPVDPLTAPDVPPPAIEDGPLEEAAPSPAEVVPAIPRPEAFTEPSPLPAPVAPAPFIGPESEPLPRVAFNPTEPLMSYTRIFDGTDYELTALLRDYCELNEDLRSGGWEAYLHRTDDFIKFASHRMIVEMLTLHGGEGKRRVVFKLRKYR